MPSLSRDAWLVLVSLTVPAIKSPAVIQSLWQRGEIGRHAGFKIRWGKTRVGSTPTAATMPFGLVHSPQAQPTPFFWLLSSNTFLACSRH